MASISNYCPLERFGFLSILLVEETKTTWILIYWSFSKPLFQYSVTQGDCKRGYKMSFLFSIVVFIALNSIPADIITFDIVSQKQRFVNDKPVEKVIRFTKQDNGSWEAVDLPQDSIGNFKLDKTILVLTPPAAKKDRSKMKEMVMDLRSMVALPEKPDWSQPQKMTFKPSGSVSITPGNKEVKIGIELKKEGQSKNINYQVRWK